MKQCLRQKINSQKLSSENLVGCKIISNRRKFYWLELTRSHKKDKYKLVLSALALILGTKVPTTSKSYWIVALSIITTLLQTCLPLKAQMNLEGETRETRGQGDKGTRGQGEKMPNAQCPMPNAHCLIANVDSDSEFLTQQTSVSQLSDVQPTDWAYQALRSLMERYNVISGFPDNTFKGNRPLSRNEFAAGLAATLDKVEGLIATAIGDQYIQEDIITLRRLQKEYRSALDDLHKRVSTTSDLVNYLEARQFSTTTTLKGQLIFAPTSGSDANSTIVARSRLNLNTSFNEKDLLVTQLESGNNGGDAINLAQQKNSNNLANSGFIGNYGGLDYSNVDENLHLRRLYYSFRPSPDLAVTVGAKMLPRDFIDRNKYANNEAVDFSSTFFINNPLIVQNQIDREGGAGAAIAWKPKNSKFTVRSLYIAGNANQSNSTTDGGLFGDRHQASVEVEYSPSSRFALRLQYTNAEINNTDINAFGVNAEYSLNRNTGIFTRLGVGNYQGFNTAINQNIDLQPLSWAIGVGLRNLVLPGTVAGVAIGQPFVAEGFGDATQTNFEAFYNLQLNDNVSITPILSLVSNPNNDSSNGTIWQSTLRTVFSF
ncbi:MULTISPECIES: iron uptake porin [Nostocales]|nr:MULTISPECIES: iron uptake porin [Nostocales]